MKKIFTFLFILNFGTVFSQTPGDSSTAVKAKLLLEISASDSLYMNCGNPMSIQAPTLKDLYDPSFSCVGGQIIKGKKKGYLTVIPNSAEVVIYVKSGGSLIGKKGFPVKKVPLPGVKIFAEGRPLNLEKGGKIPTSLYLKAVSYQNLSELYPKDARYFVSRIDITLVRGEEFISRQIFSHSRPKLKALVAKSRAGDYLMIKVSEVSRINFQNRRLPVPLGSWVFRYDLK